MKKSELAQMYMPFISAHSALNRLMTWIKAHPELLARLATLGYQPRQKELTPAQVKAITDCLGEP